MRIVYLLGFCIGGMMLIESVANSHPISGVVAAALTLGCGYLFRRSQKQAPKTPPKDTDSGP